MRSLKELLCLLWITINADENFEFGLCATVNYLSLKDKLNFSEYKLLYNYIQTNRPKWYQKHYSKADKHSGYYWAHGSKQPRLDWLTTHNKKQK